MQKQLTFLLILGLLIISHIGCKSKDKKHGDAEKPIITVSLPMEDYKFISGGNSQIVFSAVVTDDFLLDKLTITMEWHGFAKSTTLKNATISTSIVDPWETQVEIITLTGTSQMFDIQPLFNKSIPVDIERGYYKMTFDVLDASGKSTTLVRIVEII